MFNPFVKSEKKMLPSSIEPLPALPGPITVCRYRFFNQILSVPFFCCFLYLTFFHPETQATHKKRADFPEENPSPSSEPGSCCTLEQKKKQGRRVCETKFVCNRALTTTSASQPPPHLQGRFAGLFFIEAGIFSFFFSFFAWVLWQESLTLIIQVVGLFYLVLVSSEFKKCHEKNREFSHERSFISGLKVHMILGEADKKGLDSFFSTGLFGTGVTPGEERMSACLTCYFWCGCTTWPDLISRSFLWRSLLQRWRIMLFHGIKRQQNLKAFLRSTFSTILLFQQFKRKFDKEFNIPNQYSCFPITSLTKIFKEKKT